MRATSIFTRQTAVLDAPNVQEHKNSNHPTLIYPIADNRQVEFRSIKGEFKALLTHPNHEPNELEIRCDADHLHALRTRGTEFVEEYFDGAYIKLGNNDHGVPVFVSIHQSGLGGGGRLKDLPIEQQAQMRVTLDAIDTQLHAADDRILREAPESLQDLLAIERQLETIREKIPGDPLYFQAAANFHRCYANYLSVFEKEDRGVTHSRIAQRFENKLANAEESEAWQLPSMAPPVLGDSLPTESNPKRRKFDVHPSMTTERLYNLIADQTVLIRLPGGEEGSGCLFQDPTDKQIKLLTAHHVATHAAPAGNVTEMEALRHGQTLALAPGQERDVPSYDASLRTIAHPAASGLAIGDPAQIRLGDTVYLCGMPFQATEAHVHQGRISFIGRDAHGQRYMKIDGTAVPGMSGGPIVTVQDGQPVLIGMIANESFNPIRGFQQALGALQLQMADREIRDTHAWQHQELYADMMRSSSTFTRIPQGQLFNVDLSCLGYTAEHFHAVWNAFVQAGILSAQGDVIASSVSENKVSLAIASLDFPPLPVQAISAFLTHLRTAREELTEGSHIPELGFIATPWYATALLTALRDTGIVDAQGQIGTFTEAQITQTLQRVPVLLFLDQLTAQHRHATMTAEQAPRPDWADDPMDSYANVGLSLVSSLSTNIVTGYFISDILSASHAHRTSPVVMDVDTEAALPILSFASGYRTIPGHDKRPKSAGKFTFPEKSHFDVNGHRFPCDRHHILPQTYMQFLYDRGYQTHRRIFQNLLGVNHDTEVDRDEWSWAPFNLIFGPHHDYRSDDPHSAPEQVRPQSFSEGKWKHLQTVAAAIKGYYDRYTPMGGYERMSDVEFKAHQETSTFQQQLNGALQEEKRVIAECMTELSKLAQAQNNLSYHDDPTAWEVKQGKAALKK